MDFPRRVLQGDGAVLHLLLHVYCAVGEDAYCLAFEVVEFADFGDRVFAGIYFQRQAGINEEGVFLRTKGAGFEAFDVALGLPVDVSAHRDVKHVFVALCHHRAAFKGAVGLMPMPGANLLFGDVGVANQPPVAADKPHQRPRRFAKGHIDDAVAVEEVRRAQRDVGGNKTARVARVGEFMHMPATRGAVDDRAVHNHRLHVVRANVAVRADADGGVGEHVAVLRVHVPLRAAGEDKQVGQRYDVADRAGFACSNPYFDAVVVTRGGRVAHVAFGAAPRHPYFLRFGRRACQHAPLLEVGNSRGVVVRLVEDVFVFRWGLRHVRRDAAVFKARFVGVASKAEHARLPLVHEVVVGTIHRFPRQGVAVAGGVEVVGDFHLRTFFALHPVFHRRHFVAVFEVDLLHPGYRRHALGFRLEFGRRLEFRYKGNRLQLPVGRAQAAQFLRWVFGVDEGQDVRALHVVDVHQVFRRVGGGDFVGRVAVVEGRRAGMKTRVLVAQFDHHRLLAGKREGDEAYPFTGVFHLMHEAQPGAVFHHALRPHQKVAAPRKAVGIADVVGAPPHLRRDFTADKCLLQEFDVAHDLACIHGVCARGRTFRCLLSWLMASPR